jgi:hypothetical protein
MWVIPKLAGFTLGATVIVISGLQCKTVSPRVFQYVTTTVAHFEKDGFFRNEPKSDYDFSR